MRQILPKTLWISDSVIIFLKLQWPLSYYHFCKFFVIKVAKHILNPCCHPVAETGSCFILMDIFLAKLGPFYNSQIPEVHFKNKIYQTPQMQETKVTKLAKAISKLKLLTLYLWKGINRKQSTRWQHLSRLKASVFFSLQKILSCYETQLLILGTGTAIWWVTEPH